MAQIDIDINKSYDIPKDVVKITYGGKYLLIVPSAANWIVLDTYQQLQIFDCFMQGQSIKQIMSYLRYDETDVNYVVTQLEARRLCTKKVKSSIEKERSLHLFVTNRCNLRCPHCYMFSGESQENELSTEEVIRLIMDYKTVAKGKRITISGGEPTARNDLDIIVQTAFELGLEVMLLTNGSTMESDRIEKLSKYISSIQISIDGFSEESNSKIRGSGNFFKALSTLDQFVSLGIESSVAITPSLELLKEHMDDYVLFANKLIEKYIDYPFSVKFTEELSSGRNINPTNQQNDEYSTLIIAIQNKIYGVENDFANFVHTMKNDVIRDNCMFGVFSIASNGDVYYCPEINKLKPYANIRKTPFDYIYREAIKAEKATSVTRLLPCKECELLYISGGGCRIEEFPNLANIYSFEKNKMKILPRKCSKKIKETFYNLMIRSNEYLYTNTVS